MADDDRYRWLDDEAAERLLRGSVVNARSTRRDGRHWADHDNVEAPPTSAYGRPGAATPSWARGTGPAASVPEQGTGEGLAEDRLAALLDTLVAEQTATLHALGVARTGAVPGEAGAELSGEAAAVEAFRAAHPDLSPEHSGTVDITAGPIESATVVGRRAVPEGRRSRGRRSGVGRRSLGGRPLRAGFAMAVAGCALGGAAVAAGTGVLPTPFGGGGAPAASVSPLVSPGDEREDAADGGRGSPYDGNGPRRGTREGQPPSDSPSGEDLAGTEGGRDGKNSNGSGHEDWWHDDGKDLSEAEKKAMARALCGAYEKDDLSAKNRLRLETAAGGPEGVKKFCAEHDDGKGDQTDGGAVGSGGVGAPGDSGGTGDSGGSSSGNDGGQGDDGGESGGGDSDDGDTAGSGGSRPDDSGGQTDGSDGQIDGSVSSSSDADEPSPSASVSAETGS